MDSLANEKHYTPNEIAEIMALDAKVVRKIFGKEPGVFKLANDKHKRAHTTLRIPQSVFERVHRRMQVKL